MKQRIITGLVMGIVLVPIIYFGGICFEILGLLATIGAAYELRKMFYKKNLATLNIVDLVTILVSALSYLMILFQTKSSKYIMFVTLDMLLVFVVGGLLLVFKNDFKGNDFGTYFSTVLYSSVGFASMAILRNKGLNVIFAIVLIAICTDIFAYFFGVAFGKHKMCPNISPKKSIEGAIAGLVFGGLAGSLMFILGGVNEVVFTSLHPVWFVIFSLFLSVIGQIGDLVASKLKRTYEIKDFSNIFPGHGGILDRFDSLIFISTLFYLIILVVGVL